MCAIPASAGDESCAGAARNAVMRKVQSIQRIGIYFSELASKVAA